VAVPGRSTASRGQASRRRRNAETPATTKGNGATVAASAPERPTWRDEVAPAATSAISLTSATATHRRRSRLSAGSKLASRHPVPNARSRIPTVRANSTRSPECSRRTMARRSGRVANVSARPNAARSPATTRTDVTACTIRSLRESLRRSARPSAVPLARYCEAGRAARRRSSRDGDARPPGLAAGVPEIGVGSAGSSGRGTVA
jgi:hypothetical protein